jgi:hypothetical protein
VHSAIRSVEKGTSRRHLNVRERVPRERKTLGSRAYNPSMRTYPVTSVLIHSRRASIKEKAAEMGTSTVERRVTKSVTQDSHSVRVQPDLHSVINHGIDIREPVRQQYPTNAPRVKRKMPASVINPVNRDTGDRDRHVENQRRVNRKIRIWCNLFLSTL